MSEPTRSSTRGAWRWVPTLYFAEGLPYAIVILVSVIMYKRLDVSNTEIALYTSWLYLPWVIKPIWSPIVDTVSTKRFWILTTQILIGAGLAGVALTIPTSDFFRYSLAFMWLLAFSSATHDISADGFYMLGLNDHDQAWFVGIRSTFYRLAMISGQGLLVMLAGYLESRFDSVQTGWSITLMVAAGIYILVYLYHTRALPRPDSDDPRTVESFGHLLRETRDAFTSFSARRMWSLLSRSFCCIGSAKRSSLRWHLCFCWMRERQEVWRCLPGSLERCMASSVWPR